MSNVSDKQGVKCIVQKEDKYLLVKISYAHKLWTFPGGAIEDGESFEQAAKRELLEETGIELPTLASIGQYESAKRKNHFVHCFYGKSDTTGVLPQISEIDEARWFSIDEFALDRSESVDKVLSIFLSSNL